MAESLQEYLVSLGWNIDQLSFGQAMGALNQFEGGANAMSKSIVANTAKGGAALVTLFVTLTAGVVKFLAATAQADLEVERFARKMFTSEQNARSFTAALDAMGASYEDIFYMTPEEYQRFNELNSLGKSLEAPAGLQDNLKLIRDMQFEFTKLKMLANYGTQWVAYYFIEHFKIPMQEGKTALESLTAYVTKNLPQISKKIADFLIKIADIAIAGVRVFDLIKDAVVSVADIFPPSMLKIAAALAAITLLIMTNPLMAFLIGLFMLLEDFAVYRAGGKSAFQGIWDLFSKIGEKVDTSGLDSIKGSLKDIEESAGDLFDSLTDLMAKIVELGDQYGIVDGIADSITLLLEETAFLFDSLAKSMDMLANFSWDGFKEGFSKRWDIFWDKDGWWSGNYDRYAELTGQNYPEVLASPEVKSVIRTGNQETKSMVDSSTNTITINVNESQNPRETANEVYDRFFQFRSLASPFTAGQ